MLKPRDHVTYVAQDGRGSTVRAIVKRAHRDGSCTVEAMFFLDEHGQDRPGYIGLKSRIGNERLTLSNYPAVERAFALDQQRQQQS